MNIINIEFVNWDTIVLSLNWIALVVAIIVIALILRLLKSAARFCFKKSIEIDEVTLGIGNSSVTMRYNPKDREIAYKLWVELTTRKIGIPFDEDNDVIIEVYNSWYEFFKIARELMKEIPAIFLNNSGDLINLTERVLNNGLRPHLTVWQAKYRKWYENASKDSSMKTPQDVQKEYPEYDNLVANLKQTNKQMIEYKKLMHQIAFDK